MNDLRDAMHRAAAAVVPSPDLEDVYRRASRRPGPSRRAGWSLLVVLLAAGILVPLLILGARPLSHAKPVGSTTTSTQTRPAPGTLPPAVRLATTYDVVPLLLAAAGDRFYGLVLPSSCTDSAVVVRIEPDGALTRRTLGDPLGCYFGELAATKSGLYLGTQVIEKFTNAKNELVRLDTSTLHVTARTSLPEDVVAIVTSPDGLWVATATVILRLDPRTLAVLASYTVPGTETPALGGPSVDSLALGPGGLWLTVDWPRPELYRLNPSTLSVLSRAVVPTSGSQRVTLVADDDAVWLVGDDFFRRVAPSGVLGSSTHVPALQTAVAQGRDLLALVAVDTMSDAFVHFDSDGRAVARSDVGEVSQVMATDGSEVWLLGRSLERWNLLPPQ